MPSAQDNLMAAVRTHLEKRGIEYCVGPKQGYVADRSEWIDGPRAETKERAVERYLPLFRAHVKDAKFIELCWGGPAIVPLEDGMFRVEGLVLKSTGLGD